MKLSIIILGMSTLVTLLIQPVQSAETLHFESGKMKTTLLELFTSQGCSSCPPADDWLNKLAADPRLWKTIIPVAYHVDYWDDLGWKDPYGSAANSNRQFSYNQSGRSASVYTPGFFVNGQEWTGWYEKERIRRSAEAPGTLSATITGEKLSVEFSGDEEDLKLNVVLLGMEMTTNVKAGENKGRKLTNSFVALTHEIYPGSNGLWQVPLPIANEYKPERKALALWVTRVGRTEPLQATGGWLPK